MKSSQNSWLQKLTIQFFFVIALPLIVVLAVISFIGYSQHQRDMLSLMKEKNQQITKSASLTIRDLFHNRVESIAILASMLDDGTVPYEAVQELLFIKQYNFNNGILIITADAQQLVWQTNAPPEVLQLFSSPNSYKLFSHSQNNQVMVSEPVRLQNQLSETIFISQYLPQKNWILIGAFSPQIILEPIFRTTFPQDGFLFVLLSSKNNKVIYTNQPLGISNAQDSDHLKSNYSSTTFEIIEPYGYSLQVSEVLHNSYLSLQLSFQMAYLVLVPVTILAVLFFAFTATQIVQPLQQLQDQTDALAMGNYLLISKKVGGIAEIRNLQAHFIEMAQKVSTAQVNLHNYVKLITASQEDERLRLARELHDDTIQAFIALKQRIQFAQKAFTELNDFQELQEMTDVSVENLRRIIHALRPIYLEDLGLVSALQMLTIENNQQKGTKVQFQLRGKESRLSSDTELSLYRISQEAINNAQRHAQASQITVAVYFSEKIYLEIRDDGIGFLIPPNLSDWIEAGHFGLIGMQERADLIGAKLEITSKPQQGCKVVVIVNKEALSP